MELQVGVGVGVVVPEEAMVLHGQRREDAARRQRAVAQHLWERRALGRVAFEQSGVGN